MRESDLQSNIIQHLRVLENQHKVVFIRNNSFQGSIERRNGTKGYINNSHPGAADLILCVPGGRYVGIELKAPGGVQSPNQKSWQHRLEEVGGKYHIVRSTKEMDEVLRAYNVIS